MIDGVLMSVAESHEEGIASLREDAERYRWLRRQQAVGCWPQVVDGLHRLVGDELDATIDDAMRGDGPARIGVRLN
jgi:predicted component of type VI protein secretion system